MTAATDLPRGGNSPGHEQGARRVLTTLVALLPLSAAIVTSAFALVYPYLNAYYGEMGLPLQGVGSNPADVFWKFALATIYYSGGGAPLWIPLLSVAIAGVRPRRLRILLLGLTFAALLLLGPVLLSGRPRALALAWVLAVPAALFAVRGRGSGRLRRALQRVPASLVVLALLLVWAAVAAYGNAQGKRDVLAFVEAPVTEVPPRTLMERLAGVTSGRLVERVSAPADSPAAPLDSRLVRRIAFAGGYAVLLDLRDCTSWRVPSEHIALEEHQPRPDDGEVLAGYPPDGCDTSDALVVRD